MKALNVKGDCRVERRALTPDEFKRLLMAARGGEPFRGISGPDRARLYVVAAYTGLRCSELASLTPESFDFITCPLATVMVKAAYSKNREQSVLPLRTDVAELLRPWIDTLSPHERIWPGSWGQRAAKMVRIDLNAAGIPYKDEAGRVFDFHALRHHFLSTLAQSGAHPKTAQALARHSTIALTMDRYTHLARFDTAEALKALPPFDVVAQGALGASDGETAELGPQLGPTGGTSGHPEASDGIEEPQGSSTIVPPQRVATLGNARDDNELELASPAGLEPAAYGLGNRRSIHLSYGDAKQCEGLKKSPRNVTVEDLSSLGMGMEAIALDQGSGGLRSEVVRRFSNPLPEYDPRSESKRKLQDPPGQGSVPDRLQGLRAVDLPRPLQKRLVCNTRGGDQDRLLWRVLRTLESWDGARLLNTPGFVKKGVYFSYPHRNSNCR